MLALSARLLRVSAQDWSCSQAARIHYKIEQRLNLPPVLDFSMFVKSDTVTQNIDLGSFFKIFPRTLPGNTGQSQNQTIILRDLGERKSAMKL